MRLFRTRLHAYVALVLLACVVTAVIVVLLLPGERVTEANYEKIKLGMSQAEVQRLLGPPDHEDRGDSIYQQWHSPELTIILISDGAGGVRARWSGKGKRTASVFEMLWYWMMRQF